MELNATPEQQFMIMLQERMNMVEDELLRLEKRVQTYTASQYHKIDVQISFQEGDILKNTIDEILNHIFKHRKEMEPVFSAWNWHISHQRLLMTFVLTTKKAFTEEQMKQYLDHPHMRYSSFHDLYTFIQYFQYYYHDEDEGDTYYSYEYWHSHYGFLYNLIDYEFTDEPFTQSKNYNASKELQKYLRKWIFEKQKNWVDVLRIFV